MTTSDDETHATEVLKKLGVLPAHVQEFVQRVAHEANVRGLVLRRASKTREGVTLHVTGLRPGAFSSIDIDEDDVVIGVSDGDRAWIVGGENLSSAFDEVASFLQERKNVSRRISATRLGIPVADVKAALKDLPDNSLVTISVDVSTGQKNAGARAFATEVLGTQRESDGTFTLLTSGTLNEERR